MRKLVLSLALIFISLLKEIKCHKSDTNITQIKQYHNFSDLASACPQTIVKLEYQSSNTYDIFSMRNLYLGTGQFFTIVIYNDMHPSLLILWDFQYGNHKTTTLISNGQPIISSGNHLYDQDLGYLILTTTADQFMIFKKNPTTFDFNFLIAIPLSEPSSLQAPLITDMFIINNQHQLVVLDYNNSKLFFYDLNNIVTIPYKVLTIGIPDKISPYPSCFYAKFVPNTNYIALVDFSKALIRVIDYITSEIVYTSNDHISNIPANPSILGVYSKDSLIVNYNNHRVYKKTIKQYFQVFSVDKKLSITSEFFLDYKNVTLNQIQSMLILQNTPHAVTTHTMGDVYVHSLYSGEQIRHYKHDNFTTYDAQFYENKLMFSSTNYKKNIIAYFYDWNDILYPEERDASTQGVCVASCGDNQGYNQDLLSCSTCDINLHCKTCKFPSGKCDSCTSGYYLTQGQCLPYCKGEEGSTTLNENSQCECSKGYYMIDDSICIPNPCKTQEYPEYDYRTKETLCHSICGEGLFYDIEDDECVCISGYVKISGSCKLDISSICLIIVFIIILAIIAYKYRLYLTFSKSKVYFDVKDMQQGIQLRKVFEENIKKNQKSNKNKQKEKEKHMI